MQHPFQCSVTVPSTPSRPNGQGLLVLACGPRLLSFCVETRIILSEWPEQNQSGEQSTRQETGDGEPPAKRQKNEEVPADVGKTNVAPKTSSKSPNVIRLNASPDGKHVIAVTDDKSLRVFAIQADGGLHELSQRCMPKRPCAIEILSDNATILCADKFGDVYSLPLVMEDINAVNPPANTVAPKEDIQYKPAATVLTVHSGRNRLTLENQLRQKNLTPKKDTARFAHQLQLGHVSMLTDMKLGTVRVAGKPRLHIVTADRDEHIRLSRAPPQAHVIEGYCLGHTEFISKLCMVPDSNLLLSGGGDDWVGVWDWPSTKLLQKLDLRGPLSNLAGLAQAYDKPDFPIAVSGIWTTALGSGQKGTAIVIALEKVPALFITAHGCHGLSAAKVPELAVVQCSGNPLDIFEVQQAIAVSLDSRQSGPSRLQILQLSPFQIAQDQPGTLSLQGQLSTPNGEAFSALLQYDAPLGPDVGDRELDRLLYGVGDLRKRSGADPDADGPADE